MRHRLGRGGAALLQLGDGGIGLVGAAGGDVGQAAPGIVEQQQVDAFAFQPVVVVEPVGVDQCDVAFTVLGDDLFGAGLCLIGQLGQVRACLGEGHHITG